MRNRLVWYQNEWPWPMFGGHIKVTPTIPLYLTLNISETVRVYALFQRTTHQYEMAHGLSNGHVTDDVTWPRRCCEAIRLAILATAWLLVFRSAHDRRKVSMSTLCGWTRTQNLFHNRVLTHSAPLDHKMHEILATTSSGAPYFQYKCTHRDYS